MTKRGQLSIEYLMIIGFSLLTISILMVVYGEQSTQQGSELTYSQINKIGNTITDTAKTVYYRGTDSRRTLKIYMPANVQNASIGVKGIVFVLDTGSGRSDMDYGSDVPLQGSIKTTQGVKHITIVAHDSYVCIVEEGEPECP